MELNEDPDQNKDELEEINDANEIVKTINQGQAILVILGLAVFALLLSVVDVIKKKDVGEPR